MKQTNYGTITTCKNFYAEFMPEPREWELEAGIVSQIPGKRITIGATDTSRSDLIAISNIQRQPGLCF